MEEYRQLDWWSFDECILSGICSWRKRTSSAKTSFRGCEVDVATPPAAAVMASWARSTYLSALRVDVRCAGHLELRSGVVLLLAKRLNVSVVHRLTRRRVRQPTLGWMRTHADHGTIPSQE